jgi:hypothetical protein
VFRCFGGQVTNHPFSLFLRGSKFFHSEINNHQSSISPSSTFNIQHPAPGGPSMRPIPIILTLLLALGAVEGLAYWWMHPAPAGPGEPILVYRPTVGRDPARSAHLSPSARDDKDQETGDRDQEEAKAEEQSSSPIQNSKFKIASGHASQGSADLQGRESSHRVQNSAAGTSSSSSNQQSEINNHQSEISPSFTPLPEIYANAAPMLRCSSGQVSHVQLDESLGLHLAFFEWDGTDTGSVLEAFRHMPEACMGAIGMKLIEKAPPRSYTVRGRVSEKKLSVVSGQLSEKSQPSSNQKSAIINHQSSLSSSISASQHFSVSASTPTLSFDHTIFREPGQGGGAVFAPGPVVHAFRAVWVSGLSHADARQGLGGNEFSRLRTIRFQSALTRFRPTHARVIQGAVRGASSADAAWQAFEKTMLADLAIEAK